MASRTNDSRVGTKLFKRVIFPYFRVARVPISNNGMYFIGRKLEALLNKYGVHHKYGLGYQPQTSGQVEMSNREIKPILEKTIA